MRKTILMLGLVGIFVSSTAFSAVKITQMPAAGSLTGTEQIPVVQGGTNKNTTVSSIVTYLKTVDGAGSTLDADLLDGQHGAYYQPAATAITTSNIGAQSVTYATSAGTAANATNATNATYATTSGTATITVNATNAANATGTGSAVKGGFENGLRIIRGSVASNGAIQSGGGFTVSKGVTGQFTITPTPAFSGIYTLVVTSSNTGGTASFSTGTPTNGPITVWALSDGVAPATAIDSPFNFIAIGPN